jgi:hypothetical protein
MRRRRGSSRSPAASTRSRLISGGAICLVYGLVSSRHGAAQRKDLRERGDTPFVLPGGPADSGDRDRIDGAGGVHADAKELTAIGVALAVLVAIYAGLHLNRRTHRLGAMFLREVIGRLHLDQARRGAFECGDQPVAAYRSIGSASAVHTRLTWWSYNSSIRLHEAARGIVVRRRECRDAAQQHRVALAREFDVVRRAARPSHSAAKSNHAMPSARARAAIVAAFDDEGLVLARAAVAQRAPSARATSVRSRIQRRADTPVSA